MSVQRRVVGEETIPDCSICLEPIKEGSEIAIMPCPGSHCFHDSCITKWLRTRGTCPVCRFTLEVEPRGLLVEFDEQDALVDWERYADDLQYEAIPMAQAVPMAEGILGDAAWPEEAGWGVGMGIGIDGEGRIIITELIPGSPAHRCGQVRRTPSSSLFP